MTWNVATWGESRGSSGPLPRESGRASQPPGFLTGGADGISGKHFHTRHPFCKTRFSKVIPNSPHILVDTTGIWEKPLIAYIYRVARLGGKDGVCNATSNCSH